MGENQVPTVGELCWTLLRVPDRTEGMLALKGNILQCGGHVFGHVTMSEAVVKNHGERP